MAVPEYASKDVYAFALWPVSQTNMTTDLNESHYGAHIPGRPYARVWFDNGYHGSNYPSVDTCGRSDDSTIAVNGTVQVPIAVSFNVEGTNITAHGTLQWGNQGLTDSPTMSYVFPAGGGSWQVYSPSGSNAPGALAFQYSPC